MYPFLHIKLHESAILQRFVGNAFEIRVIFSLQGSLNHLRFRLLERLIFKAHRLRQQLEGIHVALTFPDRWDYRFLKLCISMPVRSVQVRVLKG
ncbi:hypothetical protein D3C85_1374190 [compost metagenome]